jgi:hypothetical protein
MIDDRQDATERATTTVTNEDTEGTLVAGLLRMGMTGRQRVVDRLLDRMSLADGGTWFRRMLAMLAEAEGSSDLGLIPEGVVSREALEEEKRRAKRILGSAMAEEDRLRGTLLYFVAIAGALATHGERISSQPDEVLEPALLDLAEVAPEGWREMFSGAARAVAGGWRLVLSAPARGAPHDGRVAQRANRRIGRRPVAV